MPLLSTFGAASARSFGGIGAAAAGAGLDINEAFSTFLYEGTGSAQTITNGVDLSGEGGLVWIKNRDGANGHNLEDTERGAGKSIYSNTNEEQYNLTGTSGLGSFNSNGFSITGSQTRTNTNGDSYVSWTFRKAPKFFDIVTWTGDGTSGRSISHNLGSTVGAIFMKRTDTSDNWYVGCWNGMPHSNGWKLNTTDSVSTYGYFGNNAPTSTSFEIANFNGANASGGTYVAYVFAHNNNDGGFGPSGDQDVIKCGSYTGDGGAGTTEVNLGFEPQWILVKASSAADHWYIIDNMRGWATHNNQANDAYLYANAANAEATGGVLDITSTGFKTTLYSNANVNGRTYIYMAIRRGPLAEPTSATDVFGVNYAYTYDAAGNTGGSSAQLQGYLGEPSDMYLGGFRNGSSNNGIIYDRLRGGQYLVTNSSAAESSDTYKWDNMAGFNVAASSQYTPLISWSWKRAPSYFDVVAYTGTGSGNLQISHNLGVAPEMMWVKIRSGATNDWVVYHKDLPTSGNTKKSLFLNSTSAGGYGDYFANASSVHVAPTSSVFTLGSEAAVNGSSSYNYIAYLFATVAGVSKVGSFSHTSGQTQNIDCGFSSGARFVLVKQYASSGAWFLYDTTRGIVAGNDPRLKLNDTSAENTSNDDIDPLSSGFTLTTNFSGGDYIFYAIA